MITSRWVFFFALSGAFGAGGAHAEAPRRRLDVSLGAGGLVFVASDYDETLRIFNQLPLAGGLALSLQGARYVTPTLAVGGRGGWFWTESGGHVTLGRPVGTLDFNLFDLCAVARFTPTRAPDERWEWRVHFDAEAGVVLGVVTLASVTQWLVRPRVGASMFVGGQAPNGAFWGLRGGAQWVSWDGAGGSGLDPVFSGFHFGLEGGFAR